MFSASLLFVMTNIKINSTVNDNTAEVALFNLRKIIAITNIDAKLLSYTTWADKVVMSRSPFYNFSWGPVTAKIMKFRSGPKYLHEMS